MKLLFTFIFVTTLNIHGMEKMNLTPPSRLEKAYEAAKELTYQVKKNPLFYSSLAAFYTAITIGTWKLDPLICVSAHALTTTPLLFLIPKIVSDEAQQRKNHYKMLTFFAVRDGKFNEVTKYASKNSYEETDVHALKEQNTEFLFHALDEYSNCYQYAHPNESTANNYLQAARIFLNNNADRAKVLERIKYLYKPSAQRWLEENYH